MMMTNLVTLLSLFCCVGGGSGGGGADVVVQGFKTMSTTIFGFTFPVISLSSSSFTKLNTSNTKFHWTASLDTTTGIATSKETSTTPSSLSLPSITETTQQQQRNKKKMITDVLCSYPTWLVKPRISFGLLQIMPVHTLQEAQQPFRHDHRRVRTTTSTSTSTTTIRQFDSKNKNKSHSNNKEDNTNNNTGSNIIGTSICDGIFHRINLLTFGNPIISYTNNCHRGENHRDDNKKQVVLQRGGNKKGRTHIPNPNPNPNTVIVDFPIIGGLLATITSSLSSSSSTSNNDNNKDKEHCHNNGCIRLVITTHDEPEEGQEEEMGYDDTRQQKEQHKRRQQQHRSVTKIETSICQDYHPAIAVSSSSLPLLSSSSSSSEQQRRENARGEEAVVTTLNLPIHPGRKVLYLSTQSLIHAYVMWRFHGYVSSQISNCNEMK